MPYHETHLLTIDASNRALRTFLQGLGYAVLAAVVMVLYPVVTGAHGWGDFNWPLIGFALTQAVGALFVRSESRTQTGVSLRAAIRETYEKVTGR